MEPTGNNRNEQKHLNGLLPDFCNNQVLLLLILVAELLAIVLTLSQPASVDPWTYLAASSFFIQSVALVDAALLCYGRRWLFRLPPVAMGLCIYFSLQLVTAAVTAVSHFLLDPGYGRPDPALGRFYHDLWRNIGISAIITGVLMRYFYIRHQHNLRLEAENETRIEALQSRIRPHFLFNSLNTIANLIHAKPQQAEDAILDLAELFRSTLAQPAKITLAEELELVERYLRIETLRLGERLRVEIDIASPIMQLVLPPLVLQPIVENAIYHGIEPLAEGGTVRLWAEQTGSAVVLCIRNPLGGRAGNRRHGHGNRIALDNIRQRLRLHYGDAAGLAIEENEHDYTVKLSIPGQNRL